MVTVTSNISEVVDRFSRYPAKVWRPATSRAINDALKQTRTRYVEEMVEAGSEFPKSALRASVAVKNSTTRTLTGSLTSSGKPISLKHYKGRQTGNAVTARIRGETWRIEGGFKVPQLGGHFFKRERGERTPRAGRRPRGSGPRKDPRPIYMLKGPAIPSSVSEGGIRKLRAFAGAAFARRMEYHIGRAASRQASRATR